MKAGRSLPAGARSLDTSRPGRRHTTPPTSAAPAAPPPAQRWQTRGRQTPGWAPCCRADKQDWRQLSMGGSSMRTRAGAARRGARWICAWVPASTALRDTSAISKVEPATAALFRLPWQRVPELRILHKPDDLRQSGVCPHPALMTWGKLGPCSLALWCKGLVTHANAWSCRACAWCCMC